MSDVRDSEFHWLLPEKKKTGFSPVFEWQTISINNVKQQGSVSVSTLIIFFSMWDNYYYPPFFKACDLLHIGAMLYLTRLSH